MTKNLVVSVFAMLTISAAACETRTVAADERPAADIRISAIHEAGHAVFALAHPETFTLERITLVGDDGRSLRPLTDITSGWDGADDADRVNRLRIACRLAGAAAEELVLGAVSRGSSEDERQAWDIAMQVSGSKASARLAWAQAESAARENARKNRVSIMQMAEVLRTNGSLDGHQAAIIFRRYQ